MGTTANKLNYLEETKKQIIEKTNDIDGTITNNITFRQASQKVVDVYNHYNNASETITPNTTTGKANYLKETKRIYKEAINLFDEGITDNTTFRDYAEKINDIYSNLPKITGTGTNAILSNIKSGKLVVQPKGNTVQGENPSPSNPQDIKVTKGNNDIIIRGINLLNGALLQAVNPSQEIQITNNSGKMTINGTTAENIGINLRISGSTPFLTLKAGTYTFLFNQASTIWNCELNLTSLHLGTYKVIKGMSGNYRRMVYTFDNDFDIYNINIYLKPNTTFTNQELWLMILKGEYSPSDLPDFETYIPPTTKQLNLGNLELAMIPSYNLIDENNLVKATNTAQIKNKIVTSNILNVASSSTAIGFTVSIPTFKPETGTYYVSADVRLVSGSVRNNEITAVQMWTHDAWTASSSWASTPPTLSNQFQRYTRKYTISSIGNDDNYVYAFYVQVYGATDAVLEFKNIQISKENLEYEPRDAYSDIIFKNEPNNANYDSTLVENAWYKKEIIGKRVLNGSETWGTSNNIRYTSTITDYALNNNIPYSDYFIGDKNKTNTGDTFLENSISFNNSDTYDRMYIKASSISDIRIWLQQYNLTIYYIKRNSTNIQITSTTLINQLEELNRTIVPNETIIVETESDEENVQLIVSASALDN